MSAYLESFLEQHLLSAYMFTESQDDRTVVNNVKSAWSDKLGKFIWSTPEFKAIAPELDKDCGVGIHSNQKHSATAASKCGCTSEHLWTKESCKRKASACVHWHQSNLR